MPSSRRLFAALALLTLTLVPTHARATQFQSLDTRALSRASHDIVVGRVTATRARWNERHTKIVTDVTVDVSESLKGDGAPTMKLTQLGGEVDGARYTVPGCPAFRTGEEALLFVWRDSEGRAQVTGMAQGKFDISTDETTGEKLIQRSLPGLAVRDLATLAGPSATGRPARLRLADFRTVIRRALTDDGGGR